MQSPLRHVQLLAALFVLMGVIDGLVAPYAAQSPFAAVYTFGIALILYRWCKAHAASRGIDPPLGAALLVAFLAPVGVPLYFFRTLPLSAAVWSVAKATGLAVALLALYAGVFFLAYSLRA